MKMYGVTDHAVERAVERLGRKKENARHDLIQRMQTAYFQGETSDGRVFDHHPSRSRFILAKTDDIIITVYSMDTIQHGFKAELVPIAPKPSLTNVIIEKAREVITKEIAKARRQFTTESRKLTLAEAEIGFEIATLALNKARCKAPHTQATIQSRINELEQGRQAVFAELLTVKERFEQMRRDAEGYL